MNKYSIKEELTSHVLNLINDGVITNESLDEAHYHAFNEDYYFVYYYEATEWLIKMEIDIFEGIEYCQEYEKSNYGECRTYSNSVELANMIVYIIGEELLNEFEFETVDELETELNDYLNN